MDLAAAIAKGPHEPELDLRPYFALALRGARLLLRRHAERVERLATLLAHGPVEGDALAHVLRGLGRRRRIEDAPPAWFTKVDTD